MQTADRVQLRERNIPKRQKNSGSFIKACNVKIKEQHLLTSSKKRQKGDLPNVSKRMENVSSSKLYTFSDNIKQDPSLWKLETT